MLDGILVERGAAGLRIVREWRRSSGWVLLLWVALWTGIVLFFTSIGGHRDVSFTAMLLLPGVAMTYVAAAHFVNRTEIDVTPSGIAVHHGPLPWYARRPVPRARVAALRIDVRRVHTKGASYDLCRIWVRRPGGGRSLLLEGLGLSSLETQAIASDIARHLGVPVET